MAPRSHDDNSDESPPAWMSPARRKFLAAIGLSTTGFIAGCGGDGGGTPTANPTATPTEASGMDGEDGEDGEETETTETTAMETETETETETQTATEMGWDDLIDYAMPNRQNTPRPPDITSYVDAEGATTPQFGGTFTLSWYERSFIDKQFYGEMVKNIEYQPGVLDLELEDNIYFWDGDHVDADHFVKQQEFFRLLDWPEQQGNEHIVRVEKTGDYSVRAFMADTFNRGAALDRAYNSGTAYQSKKTGWPDLLERARDATTEEEIVEIAESDPISGPDKDPNPYFNIPWKIVDTTPQRWRLGLRVEDAPHTEAPETPLFADNMNWKYLDRVVIEGNQSQIQRENQWFREGTSWYRAKRDNTIQELRDMHDFELTHRNIPRVNGAYAFTHNMAAHPADNRHFRKAFAYLHNKKKYAVKPSIQHDKIDTGLPDILENKFVPDSLKSSMTRYGWDQTMTEKARAEMDKSFETNSDGYYLANKDYDGPGSPEGGIKKGEPIQVPIASFSWFGNFRSLYKPMIDEFDNAGIKISLPPPSQQYDGSGGWGEITSDTPQYITSLAWWGSILPSANMQNAFTATPIRGTGHSNFPEEVEAPPVGEPDGDPVTYTPASTVQQLAVTNDEELLGQRLQELAWLFNQTLPKSTNGHGQNVFIFNIEDFDVMPAQPHDDPNASDHPEKLDVWAGKCTWNDGGVKLNPDAKDWANTDYSV